MGNFTLEELEAIMAVHDQTEADADLEATMATLADNPSYELPILGWKFEGWDAVYEWYRRTLPKGLERHIGWKKRVHLVGPNTLCREAYVWIEKDGERIEGQYAALVVVNDEGKIVSERLYLDPYFSLLFEEDLGPDWEDVPGVSRLPWTKHAQISLR